MRADFCHSGLVGDVIYALPTIRALGGGTLNLFTTVNWSRGLTSASVAAVRPLLCAQPYIEDCHFSPDGGEVNLDDWLLAHGTPGLTIADLVLRQFGCSTALRDERWLEVPSVNPVAPVVIHRSPRYRNPVFPWRRVWETYRTRAVMVGSPDEHADFCAEIGPIDYQPTADYLELASVIAGCELFVGNQSSPLAIAEGLKVSVLQEVYSPNPNCVFERPDAIHGIDATVTLPHMR